MSILTLNINADWTNRHPDIRTQESLGRALALAIANPVELAEEHGLDAPENVDSPSIVTISEVTHTMRDRLLRELRQWDLKYGCAIESVGYSGRESLLTLWDASKFSRDTSYKPAASAKDSKTVAIKLDLLELPDDDGEVEHRTSFIHTSTHWSRTAYARKVRAESAEHRATAILIDDAKNQEVDSVEGSGDYNLGKKDYHDINRLAKALKMPVGSFAFSDNSCDNIWSTFDPVWVTHSFGEGLFKHAPQLAKTPI